MYAISFDMVIADLKKYYGEPYNNAYNEIKEVLKRNGFYWIQGSTYASEKGTLSNLFDAIRDLSDIEWFRQSVRDIRGFKIEDWSDFTASVKKRVGK
jgi:virulence-associated protein VapD